MSRKINWMLSLPFFLMLTLLLQRAQAQKDSSPRERLDQYVAKLQRSPIDDALQEKIIKTARELKPPPEIPEEARRHFMNAAAIQKPATDQTSYELAISEYREAIRLATWWAEAYFNLSVTLEAAVRLDNAIAELKRYPLTEPNIEDPRAARDRIYAIAGKKELGVEALAGRWRGTNWWERGSRRGGPFSIEFAAIIRDKEMWFLPTRARVGYLRGIIDADQVENIRWETGYFTRPPPAWVREIAPLGSWFLDLGPPRRVEVEITGSPDRIRYKMPMYSARALDLGDNRYYFLKDAWEFFDLQKVNE
jgi:tetratricopeptide (TPR) repeat protein